VEEARRHPRYAVSVAAEIVVGSGLQRCEVEDLSVGGCRVRPVFPLSAGAEIRVRLVSAVVPFDLSGPALVAWSSATPPYLAGLRFAPELADDAARFLQALLGPVRLANPRPGGG
jgi:hypothetical protein